MDEIIMNELNNNDYEVETVDTMEPSGLDLGLVGKIAAGVGLAGVIGGIAYLFINKDKIKEKRAARHAEKLRKQGYIVFAPEEVVASDDDDEEYENE